MMAKFTFNSQQLPVEPFGVDVLCVNASCTRLVIDCSTPPCSVRVNTSAQPDSHHASITTGPLLPLVTSATAGNVTVLVHAVVDHTIVEVIFNNRTAMVVYAYPPSASAKACSLFAVGGGVKGTIETWELKQANNFGP